MKDVVKIENLSKVYRVPVKGKETVTGSLLIICDRLMGRTSATHSMFRMFEALKPASIHIKKGEAVAIVGRNGCGKSTLLQILAGTLEPSAGTVQVSGSVCALLELGSGFNQDFTGLENIYLNGAIMGLSKDEVFDNLDKILEFADIGDFVTQPLRTYSTGMRLRLAFAVISVVDPDLLIIDEALSVGDAFFQSKCVRWIEDYLKRGNTFLCVSHDMFMVQRLCQRGIVLDQGKMMFDGGIADATNLYYRLHGKNTVERESEEKESEETQILVKGWEPLTFRASERTGDGRITIESVRTQPGISGDCQVGDWLAVEVEVLAHEEIDYFHFGFGFRDRSGQLIGGYHSFYSNEDIKVTNAGERKVIKFDIQLDLRPQLYLLVIGLAINHTVSDWHDLDCRWDCAQIAVAGPEPFWGLTRLPVRNCCVKNFHE